MNRIWRDLKCTKCGQPDGFTMDRLGLPMDYHCDKCDDYTPHEYIGKPYARGENMERIEMTLDYAGDPA